MIISKTRMGMSNSAAATAIAIERYKPIAIINQGTSGGHDPKLNVYDIILGKYAANIGAFKTPSKAVGVGSNSLEWVEAFDVLPEDETDPEPIAIRKFQNCWQRRTVHNIFIKKAKSLKEQSVQQMFGTMNLIAFISFTKTMGHQSKKWKLPL